MSLHLKVLRRLLGKTRRELRQILGEPPKFGGFSGDLPWETVWEYDNLILIFDDEYHVGTIFSCDQINGLELVLTRRVECQLR